MEIIFYLLTFIFIFIFYIIFVGGKNLTKYKNSMEFKYLTFKYKLNNEKLSKKLFILMALANSFIITLTLYLASFISNFILMILAGFVIVLVLELAVYHIIGSILKKRG